LVPGLNVGPAAVTVWKMVQEIAFILQT
ncbi:hypothetical protein A2U01_0087280, partial [Trifolium medium]|nr:hypothetical protein [Trifolium medium]